MEERRRELWPEQGGRHREEEDGRKDGDDYTAVECLRGGHLALGRTSVVLERIK